MSEDLSRQARLVLTLPDGEVVGSLPPVEVATPWWQEAEPIVRAVRERDGIDVVILRILDAERPAPPGGLVTYLAEVARPCPALPWSGHLVDQPKRLSYARPGGPAADLDWAGSVMSANGIAAAGRPLQVRTWNLSSLWRLPSDRGMLWLKVLPPFAAPEGALIGKLPPDCTPRLIACDGARMLMEEIPGRDLYDAEQSTLVAMVEMLVRLQAGWIARIDELLAIGLPDWRRDRAGPEIAGLVERAATGLSAPDRAELDSFVAGLDARFEAVEACGIGPSLVHGDFHPGNFRGDGDSLTMLDFADSVVGHPLFDMPPFLDRIRDSARAAARDAWFAAWRAAIPGSDPERAAALLAPVAAARQAALYQHFLDSIETAEHPYHRDDPREWLERTARILRSETQPPSG